MRKWAVRALTPPTASDEAAVPQKTSEQEAESQPSTEGETGQGQAQVGDMRSVKADLPLPSSAKLDGTLTNAAYAEKSTEAQPVESDSMSGQPSVDPPKPNDTADKRSEASTNPPPIKREKRPESPGLASRLDRPLSQPTSREARSRRGRTPPPIQSSRRSPSPDIQRKRSVLQPGPSLADRMTGGRAGETSLLSRLDNNGKSDNNRRREPPQDSRPLKRSKKDENKDSMRNSGEMQVDSDQLANRVQASRARSQSPPPSSRGIAILGASRNRPAAPSGEPEKMNVTAASNARPDKGAQEREALKAGPGMVASEAPQGTPEEPKPKDTSTASSNGLPARPAGFASLPPKPPVVVPPPSFTTRGPPRGGSSTPNPALLDSYRPGPPPRRSSARGPPPLDPYQSAPPKDAPLIDRYVPRRDPPPAHGPRVSCICS